MNPAEDGRMRRWLTGITVVAWVALVPQGAAAQAPAVSPFTARAAEVIKTYGTEGRLPREAFTRYVNDELFMQYDSNEDGVLNVDEYAVIRLRTLSSDCESLPTLEASFAAERSAASDGRVDAVNLLSNNQVWKQHVDSSVAVAWSLATGGGTALALDQEALAAYLAAEHAHSLRIPTAGERLNALSMLAGANRPITSEVGRRFYFQEWFERADTNRSGSVDWLEFTAAVDYPRKIQEFCAISRGVALDHPLDLALLRAEASELFTIVDTGSEALWRELNPAGGEAADVEQIRRTFDRYEAAALDELRKATLGERGFVPDRGWLLTPARIVRNDAVTWDRNKHAVFLRLIKDFTVDDSAGAEAALFSLSKEAGEDAVFTIESTVQVDIYPANRTFLRGAVGVDVARITGGANATDTQTFYGFAKLFLWHGGVLEYSGLTFSPFLERDRAADVSRFAGLILWQPGFRVGRFLTNAWRPAGTHAQWYVTPRVALEFGEQADLDPTNDGKEDTTHARFELLAGVTIGRIAEINYKRFERFPVGNDFGHTAFQELSASWKLDEHDRFSLKGNYARGEKTVTATARKIFTLGVGIKF